MTFETPIRDGPRGSRGRGRHLAFGSAATSAPLVISGATTSHEVAEALPLVISGATSHDEKESPLIGVDSSGVCERERERERERGRKRERERERGRERERERERELLSTLVRGPRRVRAGPTGTEGSSLISDVSD